MDAATDAQPHRQFALGDVSVLYRRSKQRTVSAEMTHLALITLALLCQDHLYRPTPHLGDGYWQEIYPGTGWVWWTWPGCKNRKFDRPSKGVEIVEPTLTGEGYFNSLPTNTPRYMPPRGTKIDERGRVIPPRPIPGTVPWNL
jgi:hypothetical protein